MSIPFFDLLLASKAFGGGGTPEQSVTTEGVPPLSFQSNGKPATAYSIVANMTQSGAPSTASPSIPQQFGDLVTTGTHAGEYEIPITVGGSTKTIYLDQPLRKIGDYADTISSDGTVTRRIVEVVLTGQESWGYSIGMHKLGIDPPNLYLRELKLIAVCSHYKAVANQPQASLQNGELTFLVSGSGSNLLYIRDTDYSDSATFKEQLALLYALNAPVRVWYVLAEAETETVTVPELTLNNGSNTLTVGTTQQPSDFSITCTTGGGSTPAPVLVDKTITANGEYDPADDDADGYSSVSVSVANSYSAGDEGKVVSNGALVSQSSSSASSNGTVDTTLINSLAISVPNTYAAGDEGKVVSNGALVAQGNDEATQNGTVDTTLISSLLVNVASGGGITEGTLTPSGTAYTNPVAKVWGTDGFICAVLNDYYYRVSSQYVQIGTVSGITFPSSQPQTANVYVIGLNEQLGSSGGTPLESASFDWVSGDITVKIVGQYFGNNTNMHAAVVITW